MTDCCSGLAEAFFLFLGFCDAVPCLEPEGGAFCFSSSTTAAGEETIEGAGLGGTKAGETVCEMDIFLDDAPFAVSFVGPAACIDESNIKFCGGISQAAGRGPGL